MTNEIHVGNEKKHIWSHPSETTLLFVAARRNLWSRWIVWKRGSMAADCVKDDTKSERCAKWETNNEMLHLFSAVVVGCSDACVETSFWDEVKISYSCLRVWEQTYPASSLFNKRFCFVRFTKKKKKTSPKIISIVLIHQEKEEKSVRISRISSDQPLQGLAAQGTTHQKKNAAEKAKESKKYNIASIPVSN